MNWVTYPTVDATLVHTHSLAEEQGDAIKYTNVWFEWNATDRTLFAAPVLELSSN